MTTAAQWWARTVTAHSRLIIVVFLLVTVGFAAGVPFVEQNRDLGQFEGESEALNASVFIEENVLSDDAANRTPIQVIRRGEPGENVLTREELIDTLDFQQALKEHPDIGPTLAEGEPITGVGNIVALQYIRDLFVGLENGTSTGAGDDIGESNQSLGDIFAGNQTLGDIFAGNQTTDGNQTLGDIFAGNQTTGGNQTLGDIFAGNQTLGDIFAGNQTTDGNQTLEDIFAGNQTSGGNQSFEDILPGNQTTGDEQAFEAFAEALPGDARSRLLAQFTPGLVGVGSSAGETCLEEVSEENTTFGQGDVPPLSCQRLALEVMGQETFDETIQTVLGPSGEPEALALMPDSYEPGSTEARAHNMFIFQETSGGSIQEEDGFSENVTTAQFALRDLANDRDREYVAFGFGLLDVELQQSLEDSMFIVVPVALLFVLAVLVVVYRDLYDILLGLGGIVTVLVWTAGFMGWFGFPFNQMMVAVPALLVGLSVDYALHVFMRYRENRPDEGGVDGTMRVALGGVVVALAWVTATAGIGFLSNLTSPIKPLRDFGITSTFGIVASLLVFGALVPAAKVEIENRLESSGRDRSMPAFGTGNSWLSRGLQFGAVAARKAPIAVLVVALLLSVGGAYGAAQVDTSFNQENFLAGDAPPGSERLPEPFAPGEYRVIDDISYIMDNFQQVGREGELLVRGNVTDEQILVWLESANRNASQQDAVFTLPNGAPDVRSPLSSVRDDGFIVTSSEQVVGDDETPTENVSGLFDAARERSPSAPLLFYREAGEYEALRMEVSIAGDASQSEAAADLRTIATHLETVSDGQLDVVATGDIVTNAEIEENLFDTVVRSLTITLVVVFLFLVVAYRLTGNTASLGVVTLFPVLFSMSWILGTMWLLGLSFNALTGTISALSLGLGIDYSIHVSDRYHLELQRQDSVRDALDRTVTGTGGALLGTAATTVGGFWTLMLALIPAVQDFGLIIGLTIIYAFLASVFVLPSMLVLWTRYLGPGEPAAESDTADATEERVSVND